MNGRRMNCKLCIWYLLSRRVIEERGGGAGGAHFKCKALTLDFNGSDQI